MKDREFVKLHFPDAYLESEEFDHWIWAIVDDKLHIIGDGFTPGSAWESAKEWVEEYLKYEKP